MRPIMTCTGLHALRTGHGPAQDKYGACLQGGGRELDGGLEQAPPRLCADAARHARRQLDALQLRLPQPACMHRTPQATASPLLPCVKNLSAQVAFPAGVRHFRHDRDTLWTCRSTGRTYKEMTSSTCAWRRACCRPRHPATTPSACARPCARPAAAAAAAAAAALRPRPGACTSTAATGTGSSAGRPPGLRLRGWRPARHQQAGWGLTATTEHHPRHRSKKHWHAF